MSLQRFGEHLPLRDDHSRTTGSTESQEVSTTTGSSISVAPGPGALAAKFLNWVGNTSLNSLQGLVIRRRLVVIKQIVRNKPFVFTSPLSSQDVDEAMRIYDDLQDLCRGKYPLGVQKKAARMVLEIAFLMRSSRVNGGVSNQSEFWTGSGRDWWNRWNVLLRFCTTSLTDLWARNDDIIESIPSVGVSSTLSAVTGYTIDTGYTAKSLFSNRTWTSVGLARQRAVMEVIMRTKLTSIKRTVHNRPHIFTSAQGAHQVQEVDRIYEDLVRLTRHPSLRARKKAASLVLEISVIISGPSEVISSEIPLEDDGAATASPPMWDELMIRSDVHSLLCRRTQDRLSRPRRASGLRIAQSTHATDM